MYPKLDSGLAIQGRYGLTAAAVEPSDSTAHPSYKDASSLMGGWPPNGIDCARIGASRLRSEEAIHMNISIVGLDIAKNVFHVHGVDCERKIQFSKSLRRAKVEPFF